MSGIGSSRFEIWRESLDAVGAGVQRVHLRGESVWLTFLNHGARIERWRRRQDDGSWRDFCLYYPDPRHYLDDAVAMGATVGRFANRTAHGRFPLAGRPVQLARNEGPHHLHGGDAGFGRRLWTVVVEDRVVAFRLHSEDGDQGYPGAVELEVTYALDDDDSLRIEHRAVCTRTTVVNTTNHPYFNLAGVDLPRPPADVRDHELRVGADHYLPTNEHFIPTGEIRAVSGTPYDFRAAKPMRAPCATMSCGGLNTTFPNLAGGIERALVEIAEPASGWRLQVASDAPGMVVYSGFSLAPNNSHGIYQANAGICVEPQAYPDCVNHPEWPSAVLEPGEGYRRTIVYRLARDPR